MSAQNVAPDSSGSQGADECRVCGTKFRGPAALLCIECEAPRRWYGLPDARFAGAVVAGALLPVALALLGFAWKRASEEQAERGRIVDAQRGVLAELAKRVEDFVVDVNFHDASERLRGPCLESGNDAVIKCYSYYHDALRSLDTGIRRISWGLGALPLAVDTRHEIDNLKDNYWSNQSWRSLVIRQIGDPAHLTSPVEAPRTLLDCVTKPWSDDCIKLRSKLSGERGDFDDQVLKTACMLIVEVRQLRITAYAGKDSESDSPFDKASLVSRLKWLSGANSYCGKRAAEIRQKSKLSGQP